MLNTLPLWAEITLAALLVVGGVFTLVGSIGLVRFDDFFSNKCWRFCCNRRSLPVPVVLNRLAAVLLVFILGIAFSYVSFSERVAH